MRKKTFWLALLAALSAVALGFWPSGEVDAHGRARFQSAEVLTFEDGTPVGGATLTRTRGGISLQVGTTELDGHGVYTVWWIYFTFPRKCTDPIVDVGSLCGLNDLLSNPAVRATARYATGGIADKHGTLNLAAAWSRGAAPDGMDVIVGDGKLRNVAGAEVHIIVRDHGPPEPGIIHEQMGSFGGNCSAVPDDPNDPCSDQQFAVFVP